MRKGRELLHVKGLEVFLLDRSGPIRLVDGVELKVNEGETVSLIGPTAAGKTVTAKAILGLLLVYDYAPWWKRVGSYHTQATHHPPVTVFDVPHHVWADSGKICPFSLSMSISNAPIPVDLSE